MKNLFAFCYREFQFRCNLTPALSRLDVRSGPSYRPLQMLLDSLSDLTFPYVWNIIPSQKVIISEKELVDMAERQVDQPHRSKKDMKGGCQGRVKFVLKILKGHLLSHIL